MSLLSRHEGDDVAMAADPGWYTRLGKVLSDLGRVTDLAGVTDVIVSGAADAIGASTATLWQLDASSATLRLLGATGIESVLQRRWSTAPADADIPPWDAHRRHEALVLVGRAPISERYPHLVEEMALGEGDEVSLVCLPLSAGKTDVGVLGLRLQSLWQPDPAQMEFLGLLANSCAQAMQRVQALQQVAHSAANLAFLAQASQTLSASLDYRTTLAQVARLAVPTLGDWCAVEILEDGVLHSLAVEHIDPRRVALARELQERYPTDPDAPSGAPHVARTGITEFYPDIPDEMLVAAARDEEHLRLARELGLRSAMSVPLIARDRVLGVVTLVYAESGRRYGSEDVRLAEDLARRAALAIDNAHLFSQTRDVAVELQHAVLPLPFPPHELWEVAAHYQPAGRTEVGGDFYDAVVIDDHRLLAVIGDVTGRGVDAAAAMAQMRSAIRAYAAVDPDPTSILTKLDLMFAQYRITRLVTVIVALIDAEAATVTIANAGHLPPLLVAADRSVTVAHPQVPGRLLGVDAIERRATTLPLPAGATLLLYTDGLIERRQESLTEGLARLVRCVSGRPWIDVRCELTGITTELADEERDDDVTAIAIRSRPVASSV